MEDTETKVKASWSKWVIWAIISSVVLIFLSEYLAWVALGLLIIGGRPLALGALVVIGLSGGVIGRRTVRGGGFALGAIYALTPFVLWAFYGAVSHHYTSMQYQRAQDNAAEILRKQPLIPINGIYAESISLKFALYGLLVDRQFSFVEGDVARDEWLLAVVQDKHAIVTKSIGKRFYRLALGPSESPDCISLVEEKLDPAKRQEVQPETCLTLVFDNTLLSDTRLRFNYDKKFFNFFGDVYLEVSRNGDAKPIVSIPYAPWAGEPESLSYYGRGERSSFGDLMRKLSPRTVNLAKDGKPFVLNITSGKQVEEERIFPTVIVRRSVDDVERESIQQLEDWDKAYKKAQSTGLPVAFDGRFIVLPNAHTIFDAGGSFSGFYVTECCAFLSNHTWKYELHITVEALTREKRVTLILEPELLPEEVLARPIGGMVKRFLVRKLRVTDSELIVTGEYVVDDTFRSAPYEWVVSLDQLPKWTKP